MTSFTETYQNGQRSPLFGAARPRKAPSTAERAPVLMGAAGGAEAVCKQLEIGDQRPQHRQRMGTKDWRLGKDRHGGLVSGFNSGVNHPK